MRLFDTDAIQSCAYDIASFEGGKYELQQGDITRSLKKAKSMAIQRLNVELLDLRERIDYAEKLTDDEVIEINNPYA